MPLTWVQITELAAALNAAHPDVDRVSLSSDALAHYLQDMLGTQAPRPDANEANAIRWHWMRLSDDGAQASAGGD